MGIISRYSATSLPIGVGTLAGYLMQKGKKVKVLDELIQPFELFYNELDNILEEFKKPYIFGIGCFTMSIGRGYRIAELLKQEYPDSIVIFGGIHPTVLPEEVLGTRNVDYVVRGEGEETLLELYDSIKNYRNCHNILGISYRINGSIKHNPDRPLGNDLDSISFFPYKIFDPNKYSLDFVMSSRGCPFNCIFCSQRRISGRSYRYRSPEKVVEELELLINKYKQKNIAFLDDDFLVNRKRTKSLCEMIVQNNFHLKAKFGCQTRADMVNEEMLGYLKEAGFSFVGLGMETGSERLMKLLNKQETVEENIIASKLLKKMGFDINASFLFGLPSETGAERFIAYMLAKELKIPYAKFNNVVPYPGTKLYEIAQKEGTLNIAEHWENFNSVEGVVHGIFSKVKLPYIPANTKEIELRKDLVRSNLYFYLSNLISLFFPKEGNPGWFVLPERWFFQPKECYYVSKLALQVLINCIIVFDIRWFIKGMLWRVGLKRWFY